MTTVWTEGHFVAGTPALDFANTVFRRTPEVGADLLDGADSLAGWFARAELLPAAGRGPEAMVTAATVREARALRAVLWAAFDAQSNGRPVPAEALTGLLEHARRDAGEAVVAADGTVGPRTPATARGCLAVVVLDALALLLNPPAQEIRACDRCGWFFVDTSRGRRRRWCSMKTCGNQAKAARHRSAHG